MIPPQNRPLKSLIFMARITLPHGSGTQSRIPITYYSLDNPMTIYQLTGEASFEPVETVQLMDPDKLETQDKYGAFLHGNNGYSVIEGDGEGSILVVKDSYGNCFVPYLTKNYAKIGVCGLP